MRVVSFEKRPGRGRRARLDAEEGRRALRSPPRFGNVYGLVALGGVMLAALWHEGAPALAAFTLPQSGQLVAGPLPLCGEGPRRNCVVDGDTLWIGGEKVRVADINTPEVSSPACRREALLGAKAKTRLHALVNEAPFTMQRGSRDEDRYGRKLRVLLRDGRSLGAVLVAEGLAEPWRGRRGSWCG